MKRKRIEIIRDWRRKAKYLLIRLMLIILRPLKQIQDFDGELKSIIILAQEKIGDAILLTPLFRNLKRNFPNIEIHVVALSPVYFFFENDANVDVVHKVKQNYFSYFKSIRKRKFDLLFSTKDHPSFTFLYQSRIIPARFRVGIAHTYHEGFFNYLIPLNFHQHIVEKNCALLKFLEVDYTETDCRPYLPENDISENLKSFNKEISTLNCIGINLSAGERDREWQVQKWKNFLEKVNHPVIVFATGSKIADKQELERSFENVIKSPVTKDIFEAASVIRHLRLLISPDTALIHVASCFNVKVVGLYRSQVIHVSRFYPFLTPHELIISSTNQVADILVEEVIQAAEHMLNPNKSVAEKTERSSTG